MGRHEKPRSEASALVVKLRNALGKTQQEFAVEVTKSAISTIARWETKDPPHGDSLIHLADAARQHGQPAIAKDFQILYLSEVIARLEANTMFRRPAGKRNTPAYVVCRVDDPKRVPDAVTYLLRSAADLKKHAEMGWSQ